MTIRIKNLDHLVITATNLQATIDFYTKVLGMEHVAFGDNLHSVHFGDKKFNIHDASTNVSPKAKNIVPGSEDFCLISRDICFTGDTAPARLRGYGRARAGDAVGRSGSTAIGLFSRSGRQSGRGNERYRVSTT